MEATPAQIAYRAAERCEQFGIAKLGLHEGSAACLWGHLFDAAEELTGEHHRRRPHLREAFSAVLGEKFPDEAGSRFPGAQFNDASLTTATEVAKVLQQLGDDLAVR